jgi:DNA-binding MarR family transcriptional regulator
MNTEHIEFVDYYIRMNWHKLARMYNVEAVKNGLTISTGYILLIIEREGIPSTQLGPKMGMEPTSLSRTLKSMEDDGLIYRKQDGEDSRKVLIFLTPRGVELRKRTKAAITHFNTKLRSKVSPTKMKTFYAVMKTINDLAESELLSQRNRHKN